MIRFATGEELLTGTIFGKQQMMRGAYRDTLEIHFTSGVTYDLLKNLFTDGAQFSVVEVDVNEETGEPVDTVFPKSEYLMCGPIVDNRDGSFVVSMGTLTENERLTNENAELLLMLIGVD